MRSLILWAATMAMTLGQDANVSASLASSEHEYEMRKQTRELRKQTDLLRNMSWELSRGSSSTYVHQPIVVASPSYLPLESEEERSAEIKAQQGVWQENDAITSAQRARSFYGESKQPRERQLSANENPEMGELNSPTNDKLIERLLQRYKGNFTDYAWTADRIDNQTFRVTCSVSLDGIPHDFKFRVNNAARTCRYEGGTALAKLSPAQAKRTVTFLDEETPSGNPTGGFDPDAYLMDATILQGNKVVLNAKTLKEGREAGYSDEEIWSYLSLKDERFASARSLGQSLDELAASHGEGGKRTAKDDESGERRAATKPTKLPETVVVKSERDVRTLIQQMCYEMNSGLPMRIDADTMLLTTLPYTDNSLLYRCKMVNMTADQFEKGRITKALKPQVVATYKTSMPNLLKLGVTLVYHYVDKEGKFIESFTVGPEDL
jgi:hypothetical protein